MWDSKSVRPLIQFGRSTRHPKLPDVPTGRELTKDPKVLGLLNSPSCRSSWRCRSWRRLAAGRPRRRAREAFMAMCKDQRFSTTQESQARYQSDRRRSSAALLVKAAATPKDVIADYNKISGLTK